MADLNLFPPGKMPYFIGCNKYEPKIKWVDENPVIRKLVELFEGEFL